ADIGAVDARSGGPERPANMLEAHARDQRLSRPPAFQPVHVERQLLNLLKRPDIILPFRQGAFSVHRRRTATKRSLPHTILLAARLELVQPQGFAQAARRVDLL